MIDLNCLKCNKIFFVRKYRIHTAKYCSRKCRGVSARQRFKKKCAICNTEFEFIAVRFDRAKYCSNKCRYQSLKGKGRTAYTCRHCDKIFMAPKSVKRIYCSKECIAKENYKTFKPNYTTVRKALLTRKKINQCERCGFNQYPTILGVHHKDRNRNNNTMSNLEVLCPNCHSIEHMKHISHGSSKSI